MLEVKPNTVTFGACEHRLVIQFGVSRDRDRKKCVFLPVPESFVGFLLGKQLGIGLQ